LTAVAVSAGLAGGAVKISGAGAAVDGGVGVGFARGDSLVGAGATFTAGVVAAGVAVPVGAAAGGVVMTTRESRSALASLFSDRFSRQKTSPGLIGLLPAAWLSCQGTLSNRAQAI
jgi:hypothetical protein